jgi:hypothetical protein
MTMTKDELMAQIDDEWAALTTYLETLAPEQWAGPCDAAGWTVKDHVIHIAVWEDGINALLHHQDRVAAMGLEMATWNSGDYDLMNEIIRQQHLAKSVDEVKTAAAKSHQAILDTLHNLSHDDLSLPYNHYTPDPERDGPVAAWVMGNTFEHYNEHLPWIQAIVAGKS